MKLSELIPLYQQTQFRASAGWLTEYEARHHIKKRQLHWESTKVDKAQLELDLQAIRNEIKS